MATFHLSYTMPDAGVPAFMESFGCPECGARLLANELRVRPREFEGETTIEVDVSRMSSDGCVPLEHRRKVESPTKGALMGANKDGSPGEQMVGCLKLAIIAVALVVIVLIYIGMRSTIH